MSQPQTRMTRQRAAILEELRAMRTHPTADELYGRVREILPNISLGTVYRNLDFLAENGEIRRLDGGATRRFDGDLRPHQHVRCIRCGRIGDVTSPAAPPSAKGMSIPGFAEVIGARVEFDGICEICASTEDDFPERRQ